MARLLGGAALLALAAAVSGCGGDEADDTGTPVAYEQVQGVFEEYGCTSCHPGVNPSLDLTEGNSYDELVGIQALEDPSLYRVVAGDAERSFLYLKLGGAAPVADIPAIGTRMPPRAPPIDADDLNLIRRWILQGAKGPDGRTGGPQVPTPGTPPGDLDVGEATQTEGSATIAGSVVDQRFDPIESALVTMLLEGAGQEGGEEHYRVAVTDSEGRFTLANAPTGQYLLKAYAPDTIYVSRIVALEDGEREDVRFGLPDRVIDNPEISSPNVDGTRLSMTVEGNDLDGNYTLAVNPDAGLVFELHNPGNAPGTWSATIERELRGPWIFMAVDQTCNVSRFLTVAG
jgi:Carboxypeptidase regulatory-like domain